VSTAPALLFIQYGGYTPDNIVIDGVTLDSIVLTPMNVVSQIASDDQYHYGFNGQMKTNEWAGIGNHNTALFWEYDTRTGVRMNRDPKGTAWESSYSTHSRNPIWFSDRYGDSVDNTYEINNGIPKKIDDKGGNTTDHIIVKTPETKAPGGAILPARTDEYNVPVESYSFGTGGMEYEAFRGPGERIMGHTITDGPIQTVDYEMTFAPLPKGLQLFGRGTGIIGSTAKNGRILGGASKTINYYTQAAKAAGYSTDITGAKIMAGPFVQVSHNIRNLFTGRSIKILYGNSEATIVGRIWQNQAIGLGTLNIGLSVGTGIHNINLSSRSQNAGGFTVPVIDNLSRR
jgi:hypothetical protein